MSLRSKVLAAVAVSSLAAAAFIAGCGDDSNQDGSAASPLPQGSETVELDPAEFTTEIDNPFLPLTPGSEWVYEETDAAGTVQTVVVTVTDRTKHIANGVDARVVRDVVTEDGEPVEVTDDWYAQDADGNVWYLGEATTEYEDGKPATTAGSFEAGVDGAQAGIAMPANPEVGLEYRQEHYAGEAEDEATILSLDEAVKVPTGHYAGALMTRDINPLEPRVNEYKLYAKGVGVVLALNISPDFGREELVRYSPG